MANMSLFPPEIDTSVRYWVGNNYTIKYQLNNVLNGTIIIARKRVGSIFTYQALSSSNKTTASITLGNNIDIAEISIAAIEDGQTITVGAIEESWISANKDHLSQWSNIIKLQRINEAPSITNVKIGNTSIANIVGGYQINNQYISAVIDTKTLQFEKATIVIFENSTNKIIEKLENLYLQNNIISGQLKGYYPNANTTAYSIKIQINVVFNLGVVSREYTINFGQYGALSGEPSLTCLYNFPTLNFICNQGSITLNSNNNENVRYLILEGEHPSGVKNVLYQANNSFQYKNLLLNYISFSLTVITDQWNKSIKTIINPVVLDYALLTEPSTNRTLEIKYDPDVSGFKRVLQDQVTATLGGVYPYVRRNGAQNYRQFTIGGLLSYNIDDNAQFLDANTIALADSFTGIDKEIVLERAFREHVLDFLYENNIKLFQSATEGSFLVSLSNISLTPKKELGRRIYSFSAQATEVDEASPDNLIKYGFTQGVVS